MIALLIPFLLVFAVAVAVKVAAKIRQRKMNSLLAQAEKFYTPGASNMVDLNQARMRQALSLTLTPEPPDSKN